MTNFNRSLSAVTAEITDNPEMSLGKRLSLTSKLSNSTTSKSSDFSLRRNIGKGSIKDLILFYEVTYGKSDHKPNDFASKTQARTKLEKQQDTKICLDKQVFNNNETNSDASTFSSTNSSTVSSLASSVASLSNIDKTNIEKREAESSNRYCFNKSISHRKNSEIIMSSSEEATQANKTHYTLINSSEIFSRPAFISKRLNLSTKSSIINISAQKQKENDKELLLPIGISNNNRENYVSKNLIDNRGGEEKQTEEGKFLLGLSEGMLKNLQITVLFTVKLKKKTHT